MEPPPATGSGRWSRLGPILFIVGGIAGAVALGLIALAVHQVGGNSWIPAALAAAVAWGTYRGVRGSRLARSIIGFAGLVLALVLVPAMTGNLKYLLGAASACAAIGALLLNGPTQRYQRSASYRWTARILGGLMIASFAWVIVNDAFVRSPFMPDQNGERRCPSG